MSCDGWGERKRRERVKVEEGGERPEGTFGRLKIRKAKEQDREKESRQKEKWSDRVRRRRAGREGGREGRMVEVEWRTTLQG